MWPSLPSFRPFGDVACPGGARCEVPHCLFSHHTAVNIPAPPSSATYSTAASSTLLDSGWEAKRLKLNDGTKEPAIQAMRESDLPPTKDIFVGSIAPKKVAPPTNKDTSMHHNVSERPSAPAKTSNTLPRSATRLISPPVKPVTTKPAPTTAPVAASIPEVEVKLLPKKLPKDPAAFTRRIQFLKTLHQYMVPLNDKVAQSADPPVKVLHLSDNQLKKLALEEEERIAVQNGSVYENVMKQRLVAIKKMSVDDWIKARKDVLDKQQQAIAIKNGEAPVKPPPEPVNTGLTPKEEVIFLSRLITPQEGLDAHGYVTKIPTEAEIEEARAGLKSADFWEVCDRCNTRFQVFPDRREEDGALTTGGKCTHHWGRRVFPKRSKNTLGGPTRLSCCNEPVGSPGCTTHDTHVFKVSSATRLSVIMPFIETPHNPKANPHTAVCFDCEMGYTTYGLELLRITAVSWPTHGPLLDVLVRPLGQLLDVNTRFSGVSAEQYLDALPYSAKDAPENPSRLRIVESPHVARELFLSHISPTTPVLGHALENDLNTIRLIHPTIVDTVFLYPHPQGLPIRNGLKNLSRIHLGLDIQQGGAAGHDSFEDARATGELVRAKVALGWKLLKGEGWEIRDEGVFPPMPPGAPPPMAAPTVPSMFAPVKTKALEAKPAEKRKFSDREEDGEE
ncbi:RNA exonuclease 3 [Pleomassaria siparia CBS 279.74]|uniref:RNA exonuclease 3 n=1 Tax=Pleomassaria siparia CBS 279.74 TaxID=1314801 RepID=A0A6G1KCJ9_9PLEO|nr:RNA exonuclease 3 [Pleomassaria siparia CBS 279.74]